MSSGGEGGGGLSLLGVLSLVGVDCPGGGPHLLGVLSLVGVMSGRVFLTCWGYCPW